MDVLLAGNALAVHDIECALSGTSLGIDLRTGHPVEHGHRNHMRAINAIRRAGGIAKAVDTGILKPASCTRAIRTTSDTCSRLDPRRWPVAGYDDGSGRGAGRLCEGARKHRRGGDAVVDAAQYRRRQHAAVVGQSGVRGHQPGCRHKTIRSRIDANDRHRHRRWIVSSSTGKSAWRNYHMYTTLVDPRTLAAHLTDPAWIVVDTRFDLTDPSKGEQQYSTATFLARATRTSIATCRVRRQERMDGIRCRRQNRCGRRLERWALRANRRWWSTMPTARCTRRGYGGCSASWVTTGCGARRRFRAMGGRGLRRCAPGPRRGSRAFEGEPREDWRLDVATVMAGLGDASRVLVDARAEGRFRGEGETLDGWPAIFPAPGMLLPAQPDGRQDLQERGRNARAVAAGARRNARANAVMYCGSGVTACHNLLALEHAGLSGARIFPGSWSEWSADPARPVETGGA